MTYLAGYAAPIEGIATNSCGQGVYLSARVFGADQFGALFSPP